MASLPVAFAHRSRRLNLASDKQIHQTRFSNAALPQKNGDASRRHKGAHFFDALRIDGGGHNHGRSVGHLLDQIASARKLVRIFRKVGLRKHHRHGRTAFMGKHQLALKPANVDAHKRLGNDNGIEVRGEHLRLHSLSWVFSHEGALSLVDFLDNPLVVARRGLDFNDIARRRAHIGFFHQGSRVFATQKTAIGKLHKRITPIELYHQTLH